MRLQFCLLVLATAAAATAEVADVKVVEEIVAKVNGDIITSSELERNRQTDELELRQQGVPAADLKRLLEQRAQDALREEIDRLLLIQRGRDLSINVDGDVTRRIAEIQVSSKIADPDKFHEWIRQQSGMTFEDFRQQMRNQLLINRVIGQEVSSRISIPESEKRKYYEEHKGEFLREEQVFLRQILISTEGKTPEQLEAAEKKAKELAARARKGEKFFELARDHSDDADSARNGGELPPFKRGMLRKEIEDVVFSESKGFVSEAIKVPNGWVILRIEERWEPGQASYEEVEQEIMERIAGPRIQPRVREFLTKLRHDAFLEIRPGYVDTAAAPGKDTTWRDPAQLRPETITKEEVAAGKKKRLLWIFPRPGGSEPPPDVRIESTQPSAPSPGTP
jgi:peptidyl-prolyl cis-trans isomerase SurA